MSTMDDPVLDAVRKLVEERDALKRKLKAIPESTSTLLQLVQTLETKVSGLQVECNRLRVQLQSKPVQAHPVYVPPSNRCSSCRRPIQGGGYSGYCGDCLDDRTI